MTFSTQAAETKRQETFQHLNSQTCWTILAGGRAQRMGGKDKDPVTLNQQPLIEYVHQRLHDQGADIAVNANRNLKQYETYGTVLSDIFPDFVGPLGGMHAAMSQLSATWFGFVPCDCPNLPPDLLMRFYQTIKPETEILVAHDGESVQPVVTLIKSTVLTCLNDFLQRGDRKIVLLYEECKTDIVDFGDVHDAFINLNTPEELEKYGAIA